MFRGDSKSTFSNSRVHFFDKEDFPVDTYDKGKFNFSFVSIFFLFQLASLIVVSGTIVGSAFRNIDQLNKTAFVVGAQALGAITAIALQYLQNKRKQKNNPRILKLSQLALVGKISR